MQAVGDAREDQRDIVGAEVANREAEGGSAMLAQRAGEFAAVVDERADQDEEAEGAGGLRGWVGGRAGHERNRNIRRSPVSRKVFLLRRHLRGGGPIQADGAWPNHVARGNGPAVARGASSRAVGSA